MALSEPPAKKAKTEDESKDKYDVDNIKKILDDINICQAQIEKLNEKASEEILKVEEKYNRLRKPFFRKRNEHFKKLPKFWGTVLAHHPHLSTIIQEEEQDCLNYILDCVAEEFDDIKLGYVITFFFAENPYFENTEISKTMHLASSANARSECTPIKWKEGKDLTAKYGKRPKKSHPDEPPASFFTWLTESSNSSTDEVAETIKEDMWPAALQYFLSPGYGYENGNSTDEEECDDLEEEDCEDEDEKDVTVFQEDSIAEAELEGRFGEGEEESEGDEGEDEGDEPSSAGKPGGS